MSYRLNVQLDRDPILAAAQRCVQRWGMERVTVDDIAEESGISRATLYRLFPGGKQVLFEAMHRESIDEFLHDLDVQLNAADNLEDLVVAILFEAHRALNADEQLQVMLASRPGDVLTSMAFGDLPRIFEAATAMLTPRVAPMIGESRAGELAEWLSRIVISCFLVPSKHVNFTDLDDTRTFARAHVLPAFTTVHSTCTTVETPLCSPAGERQSL